MGLLTVQVNVWLAKVVPSAATTTPVYGPSAVAPTATVPVICPVAGLITRPGGSPKAAYLSVPPVSFPVSDKLTGVPSVVVWSATAASVAVLVTVQGGFR